MACIGTTLHTLPFVLKSDIKMGQINVQLDPLPHVPISHATNFGIWSGPPPSFQDNVLKSVFFYFEGIPYTLPETPRVLFVTALNSIQHSLVESTSKLGIRCAAVKTDNIQVVMKSGIPVLFVGPEVLKMEKVVETLLVYRTDFMCKVIDEAHLGKF